MSMKKTTVGILTSIIVVSAGTASVFAAGQAKGRNFTDVDGNGICDNAKVVCSYVDEDQNRNRSIDPIVMINLCSRESYDKQKRNLRHIQGISNRAKISTGKTTHESVSKIVGNQVFRAIFGYGFGEFGRYIKNIMQDTEDILQTVFLKHVLVLFVRKEEHEKAWKV